MEANNVDSILESIYSRSYSGKNIDKFLTDVQNKVDAAYFFIDNETMSNWQSENDISVKKLALSLHSSYIPILFKDSEDFFKDTTSGYIYTSDGGNLILMLYDQFIGELNDEEFIEFTFEHEKGHMVYCTGDEIIADTHAFESTGYNREKCDKIYKLITKLVTNIGGDILPTRIKGIKKRKKAIIKTFEKK